MNNIKEIRREKGSFKVQKRGNSLLSMSKRGGLREGIS